MKVWLYIPELKNGWGTSWEKDVEWDWIPPVGTKVRFWVDSPEQLFQTHFEVKVAKLIRNIGSDHMPDVEVIFNNKLDIKERGLCERPRMEINSRGETMIDEGDLIQLMESDGWIRA